MTINDSKFIYNLSWKANSIASFNIYTAHRIGLFMKEHHIVVNVVAEGMVAEDIMTTTTGTIMMTITTIITTTMETTTTMDEGWIAIRGIDEVIHSMAEIQPEHEEFHL